MKPRGGQGGPKGGSGQAKMAKREAKEQPKEAKEGQGEAEERPREAKGAQARPEGQTKPNQARKILFWRQKHVPCLKGKWSENPAKVEKAIS